MNKGDIDEIIKLFASYCNEELEFGGMHKVDNTKMWIEYKISIREQKEYDRDVLL